MANDLPCNITNNGNLIFNLPYKDCIYYGSLSGLGTIKKTGAYNLTMTNNNTISGAIQVMTGTMTVNGTLLNSTITVDSSANLSGFGSVGNVIISPNATISSSANSNGLIIGSVKNTLTTSNGIIIANNNVSCFPYIYRYANLINGVLTNSPDISSVVLSNVTTYNSTNMQSYKLIFKTPIVDIGNCIPTVTMASTYNSIDLNNYNISSFTTTSITIYTYYTYACVSSTIFLNFYAYQPSQLSLIIYKIA